MFDSSKTPTDSGQTAEQATKPAAAPDAPASGSVAEPVQPEGYYGETFDAMLESLGSPGGLEIGAPGAASGIQLSIIGWVRSSLRRGDEPVNQEDAPEAVLEILPDFAPGLDNLEAGQKISLVTWQHLADRSALHAPVLHGVDEQCGPQGVFATSHEDRPNPVGINESFITSIDKQSNTALLRLAALPVPDGTPVLDIKSSGKVGGWLDLELEDAKARLIQLCVVAHAAGLLPSFNGNASLRLGEQCLITSSGTLKHALTNNDFALLDLQSGGVISGHRPSSEGVMHLEIYRRQPAAKLILHTHPPYLLGLGMRLPDLTMQGRLNMPLFESGRWSNLIGNVDAHTPGSRELAEAVAEASVTRQAVWMEKHGLCVWGEDSLEVVGISEEIEHLAQVRLLGGF